MAIKIIEEMYSLEEHEPWAGAKYWYQRILEAGLGERFIEYIEDLYPNGLTSTELNDLLWFEDDFIEEFLEIYDETYIKESED